MKAIWKGSIGFGLVNIPVKLFSASESSTLDLDMLDRRDKARIRYARINEDTGKEVDWEDIVKGYYYKDDYVILDEEDFEKAIPEKSKIIEIHEFVQEKEVDPVFFERPYFLVPEKSGARAYSLLLQAMIKSGTAGLTTFVFHSSELFGMLRPYENNMLLLMKMRYPEEIRNTGELEMPPAGKVKPDELKIAMALIKQFSKQFKPASYHNDYAAALMKIVKAKASGKSPRVKKMHVVSGKGKDLMSQLKASLSERKKKAAS